jgi:high affinity Mn2+ porin
MPLSSLLFGLFMIHGQSTFIPQVHTPFHSPYAGPNSLVNDTDEENSFTATLFTGAKLWRGSEFYWDPEMTGGGGLSGGLGLAGVNNGEVTRVGTRSVRVYTARLFIRQTIGLGGGTDNAASAADQLPGLQDRNRLVWSFGKFSALDIFDNNAYSHDPRVQFMNWGLMANGAWDYPADSRGYTWGTALEWTQAAWSLRGGSFLEPEEANGPHIESDVTRAHGEAMELEHRQDIDGHPGALRVLGYWNHADMGSYRAAIEQSPVDPDITQTRQRGNSKYGFGLNMDQELTPDLGLFSRLGWNDGHTETWAFDEVDRTASLGVRLKGERWKRGNDHVGLAILINGLSQDHRDYLAAGGDGFLLGDGRLNYGTENIIEAYYEWKVCAFAAVTFDIQGVQNPGYNKDRGPLSIEALRLHVEF